jgi:hypothetical protein
MAMTRKIIEDTADAGLMSTARSSWRYYQNICGEYHNSDAPMYIKSLDTGQQVVFSKQTLLSHPVTKNAYSFESFYYNELLARFPDQELLIKGILYPAEMSKALESKEGEILSFDSSFVEAHEHSLIFNLNQRSLFFANRWINTGYSYGNDLYPASSVSQQYCDLLSFLVNHRLRMSKTSEAHSFHVTEYLKSHGIPEFAISLMTRRQQMKFYRNIKRYLRTSGTNETLRELIDVLLTDSGMPAYEYLLSQNSSSVVYSNVNDETQLTAVPKFERIALNTPAKSKPLGPVTADTVFALLEPVAPNNEQFHKQNKELLKEDLRYLPRSEIPTKVIEVTLDISKVGADRAPAEIVMAEWIHCVATGTYRRPISYLPPAASVPLELSQPQALCLWLYFLNKANLPIRERGLDFYPELKTVPMIGVQNVFKQVPTTLEWCLENSPLKRKDDFNIQLFLDQHVPRPAAINSFSDFRAYCDTVYASKNNLIRLFCFEGDFRRRAFGQAIYESLLTSRLFKIEGMYETDSPYVGKNYRDFLDQIGFKELSYGRSDYYQMANALYEQATGIDLEDVSNPEVIQKAMIAVLKRLSSYSVAFVNATTIFGGSDEYFPVPNINVGDIYASTNEKVALPRSVCDIAKTDVEPIAYIRDDVFKSDLTIKGLPEPFRVSISSSISAIKDLDGRTTFRTQPSVGFKLNSSITMTQEQTKEIFDAFAAYDSVKPNF